MSEDAKTKQAAQSGERVQRGKDVHVPSNRPQRISLEQQKKMDVLERPGFRRRWVNDVPGRIHKFKLAGWSFADPSTVGEQFELLHHESKEFDASVIRMLVNKNPDAASRYAYLMEIPSEWFEEAKRDKMKKVDRTEEQIYRELNKPGVYGEFESHRK